MALGGRYSLDFDPEFEEMLIKLRTSKFHSSLIEEPNNGDESGFDQRNDGTISSPSFDSINIDLTEEETRPHFNNKILRDESRNHRLSFQRHPMKVEDVIIEIDEKCTTDESSDSGNEDIDLNSTYSAKTMGNRRLSHMLDVLKEIESEDNPLQQSMSNLCITEKSREHGYRDLPRPDYLSPFTPSPHTPSNKLKPLPDRSYRLATVSTYMETPRSTQKKNNSKKRPHESSEDRNVTRIE